MDDGPSQVSNKTRRLMLMAADVALKSEYRYRLGALALKNGKIISRGTNSVKINGGLFRDYDLFSIHAEADCLLRGGFNGDTLVVARLLKDGSMSCSRPCSKCMEYIKQSSIKKIIYTDWTGNIAIERINEDSTNEHYTGDRWNKFERARQLNER